MGFRRLIGHVLAVFVIAGLVVAPLERPVAAMGPSNVAMSGIASMSGDMPCCPDTQNKNDCKDCPLLATCAVKTFATQPAADATAVHPDRYHRLALHDDLMSDGFDRPPPDHPPRTLV
jgi:hypothetical protein